MSTTGFGEKIHPIDRIREVLNAYSFSSAILRELLANSDDAKGTEQSIALDHRTHPNTKLHDIKLADTQGPAVLAYNNSVFREEDWDSIQFIGNPSKTKSASTIGKFGLGIRSCYHITDYLQILSGENLVIFDPLRTFAQDGGIRFQFNPGNIEDIRHHFTAFSHFLPAGWSGERFDGTIIRLPLRNKPGLREKTLSPKDIEVLFESFIQKDLRICLLFINNIRSIALTIIDKKGNADQIASCIINSNQCDDEKKVVHLQLHGANSREEWLMVHEHYSPEAALEALSARVGAASLRKVLNERKLSPDVGIAFPLHLATQPGNNDGQLFTFLPLPVKTGFPAHIHALFALDSSRQHLHMNRDTGTIRGSENQIYDEWNRLLFELVIPHAWAQLLSRVAEQGSSSQNIFSAWPDPQLYSADGESTFWKAFARKALDIVLDEGRAVWPATGGGYYALGDEAVFMFPHDFDAALADALAEVGLKVCGPVPQYLFDLVSTTPCWSQRILTPKNASVTLKDNFCSRLRQAGPEDRSLILGYLLSNREIDNIVGLPIVLTVSGQFASLSATGATSVYTLLQSQEYDLFHACDPNAINLSDIPAYARPWFYEISPRELNIKCLDPARIIQYLSLHPSHPNVPSASPDSAYVSYLIQFWIWLGTHGMKHAATLLPQLTAMKLLPCVGDELENADPETPVFDATPVDTNPTVFATLRTLGVRFLLPYDGQFRDALRGYGLLKSAREVKSLLRRLGRSSTPGVASLTPDQGQQLLVHLNMHMQHRPTDYDDFETRALKNLPIFPVVEVQEVDDAMRVHHGRAPVEGFTVYGVKSECFALLPNLPNVAFVDAAEVGRALLAVINGQKPTPLAYMEILQLTVEQQALAQQPLKLLSSMLSHAAERQRELTGILRDKIRSQEFVLSGAGVVTAPGKLIDSLHSPLRALYRDDPQRLPRRDDDVDSQIVASLSSIGLLDRGVSKENVEDRIRYIAVNHLFDSAVTLLNILYNIGFDCGNLDLDPALAWLPTQNDTLARATECLPGSDQGATHDKYLFDKVLESVSARVRPVPPTLIEKLGWNDPIPVATLRRQLASALQASGSDAVRRVGAILKELKQRQWSEVAVEVSALKRELDGKRWVPVTGAGGELLVEAWQATFSPAFPGVHQVKRVLLTGTGKSLLRKLGCSDKATSETVRRRLVQLSEEVPSPEVTSGAIDALQFAVTLGLNEQERAQLLVPDENDQLHPAQETVFNDVGLGSLSAKIGVGQYIANSKVTNELARSLGIGRLGLKFILPQTLGEDMGVSPATVVRNTLTQCTDRQFLLEFLANAEDAGASTFEVILNDKPPFTEGKFLSPELERLCTEPSIMVYNDKEFGEKDFDGIRRTHVGGKAENPDSIGQFGLGALTMFHVTECAFIFSGTNVLILDPSKTHLPTPDRASLLLPFEDLMHIYPGHTECLKGLPYLDQDAKRVNGTVFLLPLRSPGEARKAMLWKQGYSIGALREPAGIIADFQGKAQESLLFIRLGHIRVKARTRHGNWTELWSVNAERSETHQGDFTLCKTTIQSRFESPSSPTKVAKWMSVSSSLLPADPPPGVKPTAHKPTKRVKFGVAANLKPGRRFQSKFFNMLPLAMPVALPVHINASFRMSADRRQIRFDSEGEDDTRYNRWLLTEKIPKVYLFLLEKLAEDGGNSRWWPGAPLEVSPVSASKEDDNGDRSTPERNLKDRLTTELIDKFYQDHLPHTTRSLFNSKYTSKVLKYSEVVLLPNGPQSTIPKSVGKLLQILKPELLAELPSAGKKRSQQAFKAKIAGPGFIKKLLLEDGKAKQIGGALKRQEVCELLEYLADLDSTHLEGLTLLLLEDGTWTSFKASGPTLYCWDKAQGYVKKGLLPGNRFVVPESFPKSLLSADSPTLQVMGLTAPCLKGLLQERILALQSDPSLMHEWVDLFWEAYPGLKKCWRELDELVESLQLVPTVDNTSYKTVLEVKAGKALFAGPTESKFLRSCFKDLGIAVVDLEDLPPNLGQLLRRPGRASKRALFTSLHSSIPVLQSWPANRQENFAKWVRKTIETSFAKEDFEEQDTEGLRGMVQSLPVWPARKGATVSLRSARDVTLLPPGVSLGIGRFCEAFVTDATGIAVLDREPISVARLFHQLQLPAFLGEGDNETVYRDFFQNHILHSELVGDAPMPNTQRLMVPPSTLFEHSEFFDAAFGPSGTQFLLPSFNEFARQLPLRRDADVDFDMFAQCARALQEDTTPDSDKVDRARVVYEKYQASLPTPQCMEDPSRFEHEWRNLDSIRFIPRDIAISRTADTMNEVELPPSIQALPHIVSPREVARDRFIDVAWTQRARFAVQPGIALQTAYPKFGRPSEEEV